jgi:hypothetical protein
MLERSSRLNNNEQERLPEMPPSNPSGALAIFPPNFEAERLTVFPTHHPFRPPVTDFEATNPDERIVWPIGLVVVGHIFGELPY